MLLALIIAYLAVTIIIGLLAGRLVKNSTDFMLAGRKLPLFMNGAALFALWYGSETVFGSSSTFLDEGLLGVIEDPFGGVLCLLLYGLVFARPLYRMNLRTLGDLYRLQYGPKAELLSAVFMVVSFFGYIAAQLIAMGIILHVVVPGLSVTSGMLISAAIVMLYTLVGGMWAISITDFVQSIVIVVGLVIAAIVIAVKAGGVEHVLSSAPAGHFQFFPEGDANSITNWLAAWAVLGFGSLASQDIFQRVNSARTEKTAVASAFVAGFLYLVFAMLPLFIALASIPLQHQLSSDDNQAALPELIMMHTPALVQIMFFGALISAVLSTCSGAILAPASIVAVNIARPMTGGRLTDKKQLVILRLAVLGITVVSAVMAAEQGNIFELVGESYILALVTLLVPMFCAVYWKKRANSAGAIASMLLGISAWAVFEYALQTEFPSLFAGLGASVAGMVGGSLVVRRWG